MRRKALAIALANLMITCEDMQKAWGKRVVWAREPGNSSAPGPPEMPCCLTAMRDLRSRRSLFTIDFIFLQIRKESKRPLHHIPRDMAGPLGTKDPRSYRERER